MIRDPSRRIESAAQLRRLVSYDPATGAFVFLHREVDSFKGSGLRRHAVCNLWNKKFAGTNAVTSRGKSGYGCVQLFSFNYSAHRLAWLYVYGEWPTAQIDHINLVKTDNRISNLRSATSVQNSQNVGRSPSNTSGAKGVSWDKRRSCWVARITVDSGRHFLGHFERQDDAAHAYAEAAVRLHGEFARVA